MKNIAATVLCALIVLTLVAACLFTADFAMTANQLQTLNVLLIVCVASIAYCFIVGELAQNFSQMDKLWSLLPIAYTWIVAARGGMRLRPVLFALIVTAWRIRLTVNFARKGAYSLKFWSGEEDYRWSIVHGARFFRHRLAWTAFNLFFISAYQNLLVLAICLPALAGMESAAPLGMWDLLAAAFAVFFLVLETVSDEVQWKFHRTKKALLTEKGSLENLPAPYDLGFDTIGPWGVMRHPNYLGEQGVWLSLYFTAVGAGVTRGVFHWTMIGPLLLVLLFMGSSTLAEKISSKKYPRYADYIRQVFKYLPLRRFDPELRAEPTPAEEPEKTRA